MNYNQILRQAKQKVAPNLPVETRVHHTNEQIKNFNTVREKYGTIAAFKAKAPNFHERFIAQVKSTFFKSKLIN